MSRSKAEEEDYWNSSKFKAFTFDDDEDDDLSKLKESRLAVNSIRLTEDDDEEDVEKVNWSGEPVGSISWLVGETATLSNQKTDFPRVSSESTLNKSSSGLSLSALFRGRSTKGSFQSFSFSETSATARLFAPELRKPRSEYKDYVGELTPEETVHRLQQGKVRFRPGSVGERSSYNRKVGGSIPALPTVHTVVVSLGKTPNPPCLHWCSSCNSGEWNLNVKRFECLLDGKVLYKINANAIQTWFRPGSDLVQTWFRPGSDLVQTWFRPGSSVLLQNVSMERFRSLQEKLLLLDFAVNAHDGNVITAVLIFLKRTLSKEVLFRELESRQTALRHFIHFLTETHEQRLLLDLLRALGRMEDAALIQYKEHLSISDENKRREFLKSCISLPFAAEDSGHVQDHFTLLERQIIIEAADRQSERGGKVDIFQRFPRKASILNMPLITTLYYCCFYHYSEPEGTYSSPTNLRQTFKISEKQFFVTTLAARAKLKSWSDVEALFSSRTWLGFSRKKSPLAFHRVVDILHKNSAPTQVLAQYVALVDDAELRLSLAQKHKCHDIVINTYRDLKDRQLLVGYRSKVEQGSAEERKIDGLINSSQIRWKN